jgi:hypothetical protein
MSFSHALSSGTHPSTRHSAHGYFDYLADAEL